MALSLRGPVDGLIQHKIIDLSIRRAIHSPLRLLSAQGQIIIDRDGLVA
jgi:hypothetical protein